MRWRLAVAMGLLAVVPAVRAQNGGASLGTPTFTDPTGSSDRPIQYNERPVQQGTPKTASKAGPVQGTNLPARDTRYGNDQPINGDYNRPPDIGGGSGSQGVQLGQPRGGVGSANVDSDEEKYNWGVSGSSNNDKPIRDYGEPRGYDKKNNAGRDRKTGGNGDDYDKLPYEGGSKDRPPSGSGSDWQFGDYTKECYERVRRNILEGDPDFDDIMPFTSNPLYAEDPKTSTEIRPMYFYQTIPGSQYYYKGGNVQFIGLQARVAFGERWSIVMNQLGWYGINPNSASGQPSEKGFGELHLGVKYTFLRDRESNTIAAAGLNFQMPIGAGGVYQDTGTLSLAPWGTIAHRFGKSSYGNWGVADSLGFSFGTSESRANFLYNSLHFDYDVANLHIYYPFVELNWFSYLRNGDARPLAFEGQDFANIGAITSYKNYLNIAAGSRFRIGQHTQFGIGAQFPLTGTRDLNEFRLNLDFIWRY